MTVEPSQLGIQTLNGEMVAASRREPGVLSCQRLISEDGTTIHVYQRYADCAAAVAHLQTFEKNFADRFSTMVERKTFTVFGYPSAELKAALDRYHAAYLAPFGGFDDGHKAEQACQAGRAFRP